MAKKYWMGRDTGPGKLSFSPKNAYQHHKKILWDKFIYFMEQLFPYREQYKHEKLEEKLIWLIKKEETGGPQFILKGAVI